MTSPGYPPQTGGPSRGQAPLPYPIFNGDIPSEDVRDDANIAAPAPSVPPQMDRLPGYGATGFNDAALPPPSSYEWAQWQSPPERENVSSGPTITEEDARRAILQHVKENCCWGARPARKMTFTDFQSSSAFHYSLETFTEGRSTKWTHQPNTGQPVVVRGKPPSAWEVQVRAPQMFNDSKIDMEVPNTASVKQCHVCRGRWYERCYHCQGRGMLFCTSCNGTGRGRPVIEHNNPSPHRDHSDRHRHHHRSSSPFSSRSSSFSSINRHYPHRDHSERFHNFSNNRQYEPCTWCDGRGRRYCWSCEGRGQNRCHTCIGRGKLRWFIQLTVTWTNHLEEHVVERTALPDHLVTTVTGQVVFQETRPRVWPINHFPDGEINAASNQLVTSHGSKFSSMRILQQRHMVKTVPVTQVFYKYKDKPGSFFVFGFEQKVHAPEYPAKCCCGCTVL